MTRRRPSRPWTAAEDAILRARYPDTPTREVARALRRSESSCYGRAQILGLRKSAEYLASPAACRVRRGDNVGAACRFQRGHRPWNKGKSYHSGGRSAETQFRAGNRPQTWVPIGTERITKDGIRRRKVTDTGYPPRDWRSVHALLWAWHHGPIPPGHIVVFKNGDRTDIRIDNLELITRQENMRRNSVHRLPQPLASAIQLRGALIRQLNQRSKSHEQ